LILPTKPYLIVYLKVKLVVARKRGTLNKLYGWSVCIIMPSLCLRKERKFCETPFIACVSREVFSGRNAILAPDLVHDVFILFIFLQHD